jgi:hypothetical protein
MLFASAHAKFGLGIEIERVAVELACAYNLRRGGHTGRRSTLEEW